MKHLKSSLVSHFADIIVAELETDRKNVLENCLCIVYPGKNMKLSSYLEANSPFFWVFLENQKDVYQVLSDVFFKKFHKLTDV